MRLPDPYPIILLSIIIKTHLKRSNWEYSGNSEPKRKQWKKTAEKRGIKFIIHHRVGKIALGVRGRTTAPLTKYLG